MRKTHYYTSGFLIVFLMIFVISLYQVYSYTAYDTNINLKSDDNTDSWCRKIKDDPQLYRSFIEIINNYTYVIGSIGEYFTSDDIYLAKFDSSGAKVWEQTWDGGKYDYIKGYVIDSDNNIYVAGISSIGYPGFVGSISLLKYNTTGNLLWSQTLDPLGVDRYSLCSIQTDLNNSIYISSIADNYSNNTAIITKINSSGEIFWTHEIDMGDKMEDFSTQIDSIGNIYLIYEGNYGFNSTLLKINASGSIQWEYDLGEDEDPYKMEIDFEDNVILTSVDYIGSSQYNLYLMKINSTGNLLKKIFFDYETRNYEVWFLDNIFVLLGSSLFEYNYSLDSKWNFTFGTNIIMEVRGKFYFGITSDQKMYLVHYHWGDGYSSIITILRFNRSGTILSKYNWGGSYHIHSFDTSIDSRDNLYMVCSMSYINVWKDKIALTFLVKNPKIDAIAVYLDQIIESSEIFLFSVLGISCILSLSLVFMTLKSRFRQFYRKKNNG